MQIFDKSNGNSEMESILSMYKQLSYLFKRACCLGKIPVLEHMVRRFNEAPPDFLKSLLVADDHEALYNAIDCASDSDVTFVQYVVSLYTKIDPGLIHDALKAKNHRIFLKACKTENMILIGYIFLLYDEKGLRTLQLAIAHLKTYDLEHYNIMVKISDMMISMVKDFEAEEAAKA